MGKRVLIVLVLVGVIVLSSISFGDGSNKDDIPKVMRVIQTTEKSNQILIR